MWREMGRRAADVSAHSPIEGVSIFGLTQSTFSYGHPPVDFRLEKRCERSESLAMGRRVPCVIFCEYNTGIPSSMYREREGRSVGGITTGPCVRTLQTPPHITIPVCLRYFLFRLFHDMFVYQSRLNKLRRVRHFSRNVFVQGTKYETSLSLLKQKRRSAPNTTRV